MPLEVPRSRLAGPCEDGPPVAFAEAAAAFVEGDQVGVVALDRDARILWANGLARQLLASGGGLRLRQGRLSVGRAAAGDAADLDGLLAAAESGVEPGREPGGGETGGRRIGGRDRTRHRSNGERRSLVGQAGADKNGLPPAGGSGPPRPHGLAVAGPRAGQRRRRSGRYVDRAQPVQAARAHMLMVPEGAPGHSDKVRCIGARLGSLLG